MSDHTLGPMTSFGWMLSLLAGGVAGASAAVLLVRRSPRATAKTRGGPASNAARSARSRDDRRNRQARRIRYEARQGVEIALEQRRRRETALVRGTATASPGASNAPQP